MFVFPRLFAHEQGLLDRKSMLIEKQHITQKGILFKVFISQLEMYLSEHIIRSVRPRKQ